MEESDYSCPDCKTEFSKYGKIRGDKDGFQEGLQQFMNQFILNNSSAIKDMADKMGDPEKNGKGIFFSMEVPGDKDPIIKSGKIEDVEDIFKEMPVPKFVRDLIGRKEQNSSKMEFVNVNSTILKKNDKLTIEVDMKGVDSINNIEIKRNQGSLELVGKSGNKIYYSSVDIGDRIEVRKKELVDGILRIEII